jgi:hypothetical protein
MEDAHELKALDTSRFWITQVNKSDAVFSMTYQPSEFLLHIYFFAPAQVAYKH